MRGSGRLFEGDVKTGVQSLKLYADEGVIMEAVMKKFKLLSFEELEDNQKAKDIIEDQYNEAVDFISASYTADLHLAEEMFNNNVYTKTHARDKADHEIQKLRNEDLNRVIDGELSKKPSDEYYNQKKEELSKAIYTRNIFYPPKEQNGVFSYTDEEKFINWKMFRETEISTRRKPWNPPSKFHSKTVQDEQLANAERDAKAQIDFCKKMNRKYDTANEQMSRLKGASPLIFTPIKYREPMRNNIIPTPWDNSVVKTGDIIKLKWYYKITQNKGIPYIRKIFDEVVIIYQCDKSPEREYRSSGDKTDTETTSMEDVVVDSITKSEFKMPNFDDEDNKDDEDKELSISLFNTQQ